MTLLFHVDESRDSAHHFHVGLLSDGPGITAVEDALEARIEKGYEDGVCRWDSELHSVHLFHGNDEWSKGSIDQRIQVFDDVLGLLATHDIEVIARGANMARFHSEYGQQSDPFAWTFSNLLERLNERLRSRDDYGLVIADEQTQYREILQRDLARARLHGTGGYRSQKLLRIRDTAHFVDSRLSRMTQLADVVAFVLRRRAGRRTEHDARLEAVMQRWHAAILDAVPNPSGQYYTIR